MTQVFFVNGPVTKEALIDILDNVYLPLIEAVSHRSSADLPAAATGRGQRGATMPLS